MKIQVFSEYYNLSQAGRVKPLACPMHPEFPEVSFELIHKEENDKVVLQCLACGYKNVAGQQLYQTIIERIKKVENE
jgi:uncharacterized Zn finger protein